MKKEKEKTLKKNLELRLPKNDMMRDFMCQKIGFVTCLIAFSLLLFGCSSRDQKIESGEELSFSIITQDDWGGVLTDPYNIRYAEAIVIENQADYSRYSNLVDQDISEDHSVIFNEPGDINFDEAFVVLVSQGTKGSSQHGVRLNQIRFNEDTLELSAEFLKPGPNEAAADAITYPYQLILVEKSGSWDGLGDRVVVLWGNEYKVYSSDIGSIVTKTPRR